MYVVSLHYKDAIFLLGTPDGQIAEFDDRYDFAEMFKKAMDGSLVRTGALTELAEESLDGEDGCGHCGDCEEREGCLIGNAEGGPPNSDEFLAGMEEGTRKIFNLISKMDVRQHLIESLDTLTDAKVIEDIGVAMALGTPTTYGIPVLTLFACLQTEEVVAWHSAGELTGVFSTEFEVHAPAVEEIKGASEKHAPALNRTQVKSPSKDAIRLIQEPTRPRVVH